MPYLDTGDHTRLELFLQPLTEKAGEINLYDENGQLIRGSRISGKNWTRINVVKNRKYMLTYDGVEVALAYLSGSEEEQEKGIQFLDITETECIYISDLKEWYDADYSDQFHFHPLKNWMNDPNGLCWYKGRYHFYYQSNPFAQEWSNMYWGHISSTDMCHWIHLPYVLEPQKEILEDQEFRGGAYSGSAFPMENEVKFFLTRHIHRQGEQEKQKEWQTMMSSTNMVQYSDETCIIEKPPVGAGNDFRDPKVFVDGQFYYLVLATNYNNVPTIVLYRSEDLKNWKFIKKLISEEFPGAETYECPDFFRLGENYVGMATVQGYKDENGRIRRSRYYIGDFEKENFREKSKGWLDFGGNLYAGQTFEKDGKRILVGWVSDYYEEHVYHEKGSYGSFSIPRIVSVRGDRLCFQPIPEIYTLRDKCILDKIKHNETKLQIPGEAYFVSMKFDKKTDFTMVLGRQDEKEIRLIYNNNILELQTTGVPSEGVKFQTEIKKLEKLEIFADRKTIEVYANKGSDVGTKTFYQKKGTGIFELQIQNVNAVNESKIYTMRSMWEEKR